MATLRVGCALMRTVLLSLTDGHQTRITARGGGIDAQ